MQLLAGFVISFAITCVASYSVLMERSEPKSAVLAKETSEPSPTSEANLVVSASTILETALPTGEPIEEPNPTPTQTPKPTDKATSTPIPSPVPTQTPEPTPAAPTSTPDVWSPASMEPLFAQYSGQYGVDKNLLERIANCESHFNPNAVNGAYVGLFQFGPNTWSDYRRRMGMDPNPDLRMNIEESIKTAAFMASQRGSAPWPSCV